MDYKKEGGGNLPDLPPIKLRPPMKKSEDLPELPEMNDNLESERNSLPSFPDSPIKKGFSQSAIKEAINKPEENKELPPIPEAPKAEKPLELEKEWKPSLPPIHQEDRDIMVPRQKDEDVYVKIDRFHSAKKTLKASREKVEEIEILLKRIRDIKLREDQELDSWEKEITEVKAKINDVTSTIFEKA